jgi:hypothetical protein
MMQVMVKNFIEDSEKQLKLEGKMTESVLRKLAAINLAMARS